MKHLFIVQNVRKILMHFLRMELRYKHTQKKKNEITIHTHTKNRTRKMKNLFPRDDLFVYKIIILINVITNKYHAVYHYQLRRMK